MRVACLVSYFPNISETFILDQITGLLERGCEVEIFTDEPPPDAPVHPEIEQYELARKTHAARRPRRLPWRPFRALALAAKAPRFGPLVRSLNFVKYGPRAASLRLFFDAEMCLRRGPFDILHCHFGPNGLRGLSLREIGALSGKLIVSFYGYDVSQYVREKKSNPYVNLFPQASRCLVVSQSMKNRLVDLGCDPRRAVVHRLGVNPSLFTPLRHTSATGPIRILTIGRMVPKKGIESGVRAVAQAMQQLPPIEYTIVGDGPLRAGIEKLVAELGLRDIVRLTGWQSRPEVMATLAKADILLAPSLTAGGADEEGTPVVILEAMASGLPVLSTRHAGIPEVVRDEASGLLVPEGDVAALATALRNLAANPELRTQMGRAGRSIVEERHDLAKLNNQLVEIYREVLRQT